MAPSRFPTSFLTTVLVLLLAIPTPTYAHGGHDRIPEGAALSEDPLDSILWLHILLMILAFGILYPLGMVLGITHSRWHVPLQILATLIAIPAYFMGHMHKGRQFRKPHIHASFANSLVLMTIVQVGIGVGLKLHLEAKQGWLGKVFGSKSGKTGRRIVVVVHSWIGKLMPVVAWTQMLFGGIVALGFCRGEHTGQCLAHFIMGSAFVGYGIVMTLMLLVGQAWLRRVGRSQEFFDSIVIAAWGCVNTFTEHRWGGPWVKNDLQHTSMGIVWWCAGLLGVWLSRSRRGAPRRNILPGIVIIMTGWGMSAHPQELELSTMVHRMFGYTLMAAGATRIIEICFTLKDSRGGSEPSSWQHLPPFLLYASGLLFMGATEEQMALLAANNVTHVSYILILYSIAFLLYLFVNILLHIYATATWPDDESNGVLEARAASYYPPGGPSPVGAHAQQSGQRAMSLAAPNGLPMHMRGGAGMHSRKASTLTYSDLPVPQRIVKGHRPTDSQQLRDAEEFELEGLMSEDEEVRGSGSGSGETEMTSPMLGSDDGEKGKGRSKIGSGV
ncbi:Protein YTP1 [Cyphellophora attinorum]|uniref:Protein YTP1 n=1 Tax=Cyphellophora attinorum TaxID=1664694 RepID=A0A0N1HD49_9EURO|nr:Protein YTP1 [Phialophora attinorum]KPI42466.1 Protein YTP1 [Phialophora attinorum]